MLRGQAYIFVTAAESSSDYGSRMLPFLPLLSRDSAVSKLKRQSLLRSVPLDTTTMCFHSIAAILCSTWDVFLSAILSYLILCGDYFLSNRSRCCVLERKHHSAVFSFGSIVRFVARVAVFACPHEEVLTNATRSIIRGVLHKRRILQSICLYSSDVPEKFNVPWSKTFKFWLQRLFDES